MRIEHTVLELKSRHPFHIARAAAPPARHSVWVRVIAPDGSEGWGEAAPNAYYNESVESVIAALPRFERALRSELDHAGADVLQLERLEAAVRADGPAAGPAARTAISAALHDLAGKRLGVPVWTMWGLSPATAPLSSFTIGIDEPDAVRRKIDEAASYPILKLKLGTDDDRALLELVRHAAPGRKIRIDANTGWSLDQALGILPLLEELGIELIEQPFDANDLDSCRALRDRSSIPIIADESCRTVADIPRLVGAVDGINIKLEKCGSLREAVRMVHVARAHELEVMVGCMLSTTLAIAAAMQIAPLVDYADLDAARLIANDPFTGPHMTAAGRLIAGDAPGLGVSRAES